MLGVYSHLIDSWTLIYSLCASHHPGRLVHTTRTLSPQNCCVQIVYLVRSAVFKEVLEHLIHVLPALAPMSFLQRTQPPDYGFVTTIPMSLTSLFARCE